MAGENGNRLYSPEKQNAHYLTWATSAPNPPAFGVGYLLLLYVRIGSVYWRVWEGGGGTQRGHFE